MTDGSIEGGPKGVWAGGAEDHQADGLAVGLFRNQGLADRQQLPPAVQADLHIIVVVGSLAVNGQGYRGGRVLHQALQDGRLKQRIAVQQHKIFAHLGPGQPARGQIVRGLKKRIIACLDIQPIRLPCSQQRLDLLGPKADHDDNLLQPTRGQSRKLEFQDRALVVYGQQTFWHALGQRQQPPGLAGAEYDRLPWRPGVPRRPLPHSFPLRYA